MARKTILCSISALALAVIAVSPVDSSYAWDRWHHEGGWRGGREWGDRGDCGGCGIAGALLGLGVGAAVGAAMAGDGPPPYAPPPAGYYPPPGVYYPPPQAVYPPPAVYYGDDDD